MVQSSNLGLLSDFCVDSKVQGFPGNSLTLVFKCFISDLGMISRVIPSGFDFHENSQCESQSTKCDIVHSMCHVPDHPRTGIASPWILGNSEDPSGYDHLPEGGSGSLVSIGAVGKTAQRVPQ